MHLPLPVYFANIGEFIPFVPFLIPITALMIPIVAIWTSHQRSVLKMKLDAQVRISQGNAQSQGEIQALRTEVRELREQLHAQVISMDSLISNQAKLLESAGGPEELQGRLGGGRNAP